MPAAFDSDVDLIVEVGYGSGPLDTSPTWTDVSDRVAALTVSRGRSSIDSDFGAGIATVRLDNTDGGFYPFDGGQIDVGVPLRIRATHNAVTYPLFRGQVTGFPFPYPQGTVPEEVDVAAVENLKTLARANFAVGAYPEQRSDERVAAVLDDASWPAGWRNLGIGVSVVAASSDLTGSVLAYLKTVVEAEAGTLFVAADGDLTFQQRTVYAGGATAGHTFGPDDLPYDDVTVRYDDGTLVNHARFQGASGDPQEASDSTSIDGYGRRTYRGALVVNPLIVGEPLARNLAEWAVADRKTVLSRIEGFVVDPQNDPAGLWPAVLDLDLRDPVDVEFAPPGASTALTQTVAIERVTHTVVVGDGWTTVYGCQPISDFAQTGFWVLDSSQLGADTVLA